MCVTHHNASHASCPCPLLAHRERGVESSLVLLQCVLQVQRSRVESGLVGSLCLCTLMQHTHALKSATCVAQVACSVCDTSWPSATCATQVADRHILAVCNLCNTSCRPTHLGRLPVDSNARERRPHSHSHPHSHSNMHTQTHTHVHYLTDMYTHIDTHTHVQLAVEHQRKEVPGD